MTMTGHHATTVPEKFSLAVSGNGRLIPRFVESLKRKYRSVIIYDRNEEASRPHSPHPLPRRPKVADVDAVFVSFGAGETVTIRSIKGHRFFTYEANFEQAGQTKLQLLLKRLVQAVEDLR